MGVRVDGAAGPLALGAKGSVRDRLTPPGWVEGFRPREVYSIAALARYGAFGAIIYMSIPPAAAGKPWAFVKNRWEAVFPKVDTPLRA